jgi:hypothetical protein
MTFMKRIVTLFLIVLAVSAQAQKGEVRFGPAVAFNQTNNLAPKKAYGGEVVATESFGKFFRAGVGLMGFKMGDDLGFVAPFFGTIGGQAGRFFIHADPGYSAISRTYTVLGKSTQLQGGFYFGAGVQVALPFNLYANVQYSDFPVTFVGDKSTRTSSGILSVGYRIH